MKIDYTNTLYKIRITNGCKKQLKKIIKQGKDITKLEYVITLLAERKELSACYKNHLLSDSKHYKNCGECHIEPDWLLVFQYQEEHLVLFLSLQEVIVNYSKRNYKSFVIPFFI